MTASKRTHCQSGSPPGKCFCGVEVDRVILAAEGEVPTCRICVGYAERALGVVAPREDAFQWAGTRHSELARNVPQGLSEILAGLTAALRPCKIVIQIELEADVGPYSPLEAIARAGEQEAEQ